MTGGHHSDFIPIDEEVLAMVNSLRSSIEAYTGHPYSSFKPISYTRQIVAGTNYRVKVEVDATCILVHIFLPLPYTNAPAEVKAVTSC